MALKLNELTVTNAINGGVTGNAGTVTNGVYTTGDQTIAGNKTFTGITTFNSSSDYQIVLNGGGTTWAGIHWVDTNGTDDIWFNGQNKTFTIGGGGSNVSGKKLHVDGGVTIGADYETNVVPSNGLNVQGAVQIGNYSTFVINSLAAVGTQAKTFEIARLGIDYNDWNTIGTFEVELHEQYYGRGIKKVYNIWYGYVSNSGSRLVEYRGTGADNFQCRIGSQVLVSGDQYYLPVYVDLGNYGQVDVVIKTTRRITTNTSPEIGYVYINTAPTGVNISNFTADSDLEISTLSTAKLGGNIILNVGNYTSYSPKLDGTGASGTWGINTTGTINGITINQERNTNARIYSAATGAMGLLGVNSGGTFRWQIYGDGSDYGFLDDTWGNWDIKKTINGEMDLRISGNGQRVLHAGNYNAYSPTLTGANASGTWAINVSGYSAYVAGLGNNVSYDMDRVTKKPGISHYSGYSTGTNRPTTYDYTLQVTDGGKGWEISMDWISTAGPSIFARSLRDCCQNWSSWVRILDSVNYPYAFNMNQNVRTTDSTTFSTVTATSITGSIQSTAVRETFSSVNAAATLSLDLSTATVFKLNYTASVTVFSVSNVNTSKINSFTLITQPNGTGYTINWSFQTNGGASANVKWAGSAPSTTSTNGRFDIFSFIYDGTNWYGFTGGLNYA